METNKKRNLIAQIIIEKTLVKKSFPWLNIKMSEFETRCKDPKYVNSQAASVEFSEILGVLKFLYISEIISIKRYNKTVNYLKRLMSSEESVNEFLI